VAVYFLGIIANYYYQFITTYNIIRLPSITRLFIVIIKYVIIDILI